MRPLVWFQNVLVNENFVQLLEITCQEHPNLQVQYGGVGGFIAKKPPKRLDPMKVIQVQIQCSLIRADQYCTKYPMTPSYHMCVKSILCFFFSLCKDYLDQRKLRLWDFFRNIDKDGTMRVPVSDFRKAVQVCGPWSTINSFDFILTTLFKLLLRKLLLLLNNVR